MPLLSPIQPGFNKGEISPRMRGRVDLDEFRFGLAFCENWIPLPHGSLLMRAGSKDVVSEVTGERLITFYTASDTPFTLVMRDGKLAIRDVAGALQTFPPLGVDKVTNGRFEADTTGWTLSNMERKVDGYVGPTQAAAIDPQTVTYVRQNLALVEGRTYRLRFKGWYSSASAVIVKIDQQGGATQLTHDFAITAAPAVYELQFVATAAMVAATLVFISKNTSGLNQSKFFVDDVSVLDESVAYVNEFDTPWTTARIPLVQYDQDLTKSRMLLVHPNTAPQLLTRDAAGIWKLEAAPFAGAPTEWSGENWPSCIDWGFQGRLWLGGTPATPNQFAGSMSGDAFNFTTGNNAADGVLYNASLRGALRWFQGQKALLMGASRVEQAASGNGTIITAASVLVEDESAHGSAAIQAAHLGDEVVFVSRDRKSIYAMSYDGQVKKGWLARAVSFVAEHLLRPGVKEIHFARKPDPTIFVLLDDGTVRACVFDRSEKMLAWWRLTFTGVSSMSIYDTDDGSVLRMLVARADGLHIEDMPLHETSVDYLDGWAASVVAEDGTVAGLARFEGLAVKVKHTHAVYDAVVTGAMVSAALVDPGETVVVGLPYRAKATTLPVEGGNPAGTSQGLAIHWAEIVARLSNSTRPLINGERASLGKAFNEGFDKLDERLTADVRVTTLNVEDGGTVDIEQDAPFRTEVCAIFGNAEVSKV